MTEVVALFANRSDAERAIDSLESLGFDASSLGYLDREDDASFERRAADFERDGVDTTDEAAKGAAGGAVGGAAVGAGASLLTAAGVAMIPGVGPFLAAGTLLGTLGAAAAGAAGGAALGGVAGAIFGSAEDDDESAAYYRDGVVGGGSLVTVRVADEQTAQVRSALVDMGAKRVDLYGEDGWIA